jgi:hypothetical protein
MGSAAKFIIQVGVISLTNLADACYHYGIKGSDDCPYREEKA